MDTNTEDTIEENVSTAEETEDEPTEPMDKPAPARKPRTQKQIAAFEKARAALAVKRANDKELKDQNKKPTGRPKKAVVKEEPKQPRRRVAQGGRKQTMVYVDDSHSEESDDSEPESIVVRRRRKKRKPKKKKPQQVIYISESDSGESSSESEDDSPAGQPAAHYVQQGFHFV